MSGRGGIARATAALLGLALVPVGGCGDDPADRIMLLASAEWNRDPGSVADLGYHFVADVRWIDRVGTCAHIPGGLRVTVNDLDAMRIGDGGECRLGDTFDARPFTTPDPVTVRLFDGDRSLGLATFEGVFWGAQASLVFPVDGQVRPGDQVVVSIPPGKGPPALTYASWYWLDTAPSIPPFYTTSDGLVSADGSTISATVPDLPGLVGHVALVFQYELADEATLAACTGFAFCNMTAAYALGPISLDVLGP